MFVFLGSLCVGQAAAQFNASVSGVVLVNATTDQDLFPLTIGTVVDLSQTGTNLNVRANISPQTVGSVVFNLNGVTYLENSFLYAMYGNVGSNYNNGTLAPGSYTLTVTPFSQSGGGGTAGQATTISFTVVSQVSDPNPPPPPPPPPATEDEVIYRINAGGPAISNSIGAFAADQFFAGATQTFTTSATNINGTNDDDIYRSERIPNTDGGNFSYQFPVASGQYRVVLHFAELWFNAPGGVSGGPGSRRFSVQAEGQTILSNYDMLALAPTLTALQQTFTTEVSDGTLNLGFVSLANRAKVAAIEVIRLGDDTPPPPPADSETLAYRINAGGPAVTNSIGTFAADQFFVGATAMYSVSNTTDINNTSDDNIYRSERIPNTDGGNFSYQLPVPSGQYRVVLHFAELWFNAPGGQSGGPGSRRFSVQAEGQTVINNFDMLALAPTLTALTREVTAQVTDGTLSLNFVSLTNRAKLAALEVFRTGDADDTPPPVAPPTANAGADRTVTLPLSSLTFNGSGTASPGRTLTGFQWTKLSGPSVTLGNANTANLTLTNISAGSYSFQLTVTDNAGATGSDNVNLTVNPAPAPPPSAGCGVFQAQNGLVVMEIESVPNIVNWTPRTSPSGFTGAGFYEYTGPNRFGAPNTNEIFTYEFQITQPGKYRVQWRSRILVPNETTEHNDNWLRVNVPNANDFYGERNNGSGSGYVGEKRSGFFKIYTNQPNTWSWQTTTRDNDPHNIFVEFRQAGTYTLNVSGRSNGHALDRIVLYLANSVSEGFATSTDRPESPRAACQTNASLPGDQDDWLATTIGDVGQALETSLTWQVYPNPVAHQLQVSTQQPVTGNVAVSVINPLGQVVAFGQRQYAQSPYSEVFDLRGLPAGLYILRTSVDGVIHTQRFVKQ